jgi:hypothetical protein
MSTPPGEEGCASGFTGVSSENANASVPSWPAVPAALTTPTSAAAASAAIPTTATAARTFFSWPSDIHSEIAPVQIRAIHCIQGFLCLFISAHGDESESARPAGGAICHQIGFEDGAVRGKSVLKVIFGGVEGDISYKQFVIHAVVFISS